MMKSKPVCRNCGHTNFSVDRFTASADVSCSRCGTVREENPIVSEVQYGESSTGAAMVQGAMVGADQARAPYGGRQNAMESREQTFEKGKKRIKKIATALRIPDYISDAASEWFRLALLNNFVQGRRSQNVLAACLYVACRKEKTHHMLIDFSSRLQISVYSLGATFLKMVKALQITKLPLADPSLFIQHFVEKLDFRESTSKVIKDAVKLAQRMANDWIHEGRRPAGIAGACVLLAARMNNFRRTHAEIVAVAHVAEETLQRRLNEFKKTKSGELTVESFRQSLRTEISNPPSFDRNRALELKLAKQLKDKDDMLKNFEDISKSLNDKESKKDKNGNKHDDGEGEDGQSRKDRLLSTILKDCDLSENEISEHLARIVENQRATLRKSMYTNPSEIENSKIKEKDIDLDKPRNLVKNLPKTNDLLSKISSDPKDFEDLDDEELDQFLLTEDEYKLKERVWTGLNHDFLVNQEKKRLKQEADELTGNTSGATRKKRRQNKSPLDNIEGIGGDIVSEMGVSEAIAGIGESGEPLSAADSARRMLSKKAFSKKINYASLGDLFDDNKTVDTAGV
ncbi:Piso0_002732 [Millerozyma farinosa CBS 7064]|uniref:B-related factor 1 n=1 Tax=Pichia sorbitophila (strain ATCC MYA-4447 / BCRC 22081 / CBS 7064 / NBRC 10061 / NRRL Y-12695) TaxID=559304 RepID=G8YFU0_PICSO|nr:Piso0_002732 [Millerozyma farinosa CBS 7064]